MRHQGNKPLFIAIGGRSGSGKTSLANSLACLVPNAVPLDSDRTRKEVSGVSMTTRLPPEAYSAVATQRVVTEMARRVKAHISDGKNVVVSAAFLPAQSRIDEERLAAEAGAAFVGIWLQAGLDVLVERVTRRMDDASDANESIVRMQAAEDVGAVSWHIINADQPREDIVSEALEIIGLA